MVLGAIDPKITSGSLMIELSGTSGLTYQTGLDRGGGIYGDNEGTVAHGILLRVIPFQVSSSAAVPQLEVDFLPMWIVGCERGR
jgi:hypothetical protein